MYVRLHGSTMCCYKDQKSAKNHPDAYYKGEAPIELRDDGSVEKATDYTKKNNVFRVKTAGGAEYLFQPKEDDSANMQAWISSISSIITEGAVAGPSKSQTLPAAPSDRKDEPKRRSFFTLKKS